MNWRDLECQTINPCICNSLYRHLFLINHYCLFVCLKWKTCMYLQIFQDDSAYSAACLAAARDLFTLADDHRAIYTTSIPGASGYYKSVKMKVLWQVSMSYKSTPHPYPELRDIISQSKWRYCDRCRCLSFCCCKIWSHYHEITLYQHIAKPYCTLAIIIIIIILGFPYINLVSGTLTSWVIFRQGSQSNQCKFLSIFLLETNLFRDWFLAVVNLRLRVHNM